MTEYHTVRWKTSADHAVAELSRPDREKNHTDIFSRAREGEAACERDTGIKNHTVVLKASADHAVAEFQRQKAVSGSVQHVVVSYPAVEYESIYREPTITQQRSAT